MKDKMKRLISLMLVSSMMLPTIPRFSIYANTFDEQTIEAVEEANSAIPTKAGKSRILL